MKLRIRIREGYDIHKHEMRFFYVIQRRKWFIWRDTIYSFYSLEGAEDYLNRRLEGQKTIHEL